MSRLILSFALLVLLPGVPLQVRGQTDEPQPAETQAESAVAPAARSVRQVSLYADVKARSIGDIVTVAIVERASASNTSRLSTRRSTEFDSENGEGGTGLFSFVPEFGLSAELSRDHDGSGQLSREGRLTARMAAVVTDIRPNGDLVISGEREVWINEEQETLTLTGVVRPEDIGSGNVVFSTDIAEAKISYKGKGVVTSGSRPNIISRILGWIF